MNCTLLGRHFTFCVRLLAPPCIILRAFCLCYPGRIQGLQIKTIVTICRWWRGVHHELGTAGQLARASRSSCLYVSLLYMFFGDRTQQRTAAGVYIYTHTYICAPSPSPPFCLETFRSLPLGQGITSLMESLCFARLHSARYVRNYCTRKYAQVNKSSGRYAAWQETRQSASLSLLPMRLRDDLPGALAYYLLPALYMSTSS